MYKRGLSVRLDLERQLTNYISYRSKGDSFFIWKHSLLKIRSKEPPNEDTAGMVEAIVTT